MMWQPKFDQTACNSWISYLLSEDILTVNGIDIRLRTPFEIEIPTSQAKKLTNTYKDNEETGGILFCQIIKEKNGMKLIVKYHEEIRNDVEHYFPGYSKSKSYCPNTEQYLEALQLNFSKKRRTHIYFPIHYHTHPTADLKDDIRYLSLNSSLTLSEADKNVASKIALELCNYKLIYLNSILTGNDKEHRIIFYGNGINPFDFDKVKMERSINAITELTENIEKMIFGERHQE